jgi:hypothetical protein
MKLFRNASLLFAASILAAALGCTSSPTEPKSPPATSKPPVPVTTYNVVVTANPPTIISGGNGSSTVTVEVHRTDTGAAPPDGTQVQVTTTLGAFGSASGPQSVTLQLVNGRASAALFAGTDVGTAAVSATYSGATGAANVMIGSPATFFISSVSPNVGDAAGGQTVTILGGGFGQPVRVTFGGAAATVKSVNASQIVVVTPSAAAAGVPVTVGQTASVAVQVTNHVNQTNQQQDSIDKGFTYSVGGGGGGQPSVFSVSPASGTNEGGTRVTITGTGFTAPVQVLFGTGTSAASFNGVEATVVSVSPTQIVAVTPAAHGFGQNLTNQLVDILVKEVNTGFSGIGSQQFKYGSKVLITSMSTGSGSFLGGSKVTIFGSGFEGPVAVSFTFSSPRHRDPDPDQPGAVADDVPAERPHLVEQRVGGQHQHGRQRHGTDRVQLPAADAGDHLVQSGHRGGRHDHHDQRPELQPAEHVGVLRQRRLRQLGPGPRRHVHRAQREGAAGAVGLHLQHGAVR